MRRPTLIWGYILRALAGPFILGSTTVVFLFFFNFIIKNLTKFLGKGIDTEIILQLILLSMPPFVVFAVPMGVLFATIMAFGNMAASHEVTIMKSGGMSMLRMMIPVIFCGLALTYFTYWFNNEVLPDSNHELKLLMRDVSRKKPTFGLEKGRFSTQVDNFTILARDIDSLNDLMLGVTIYDNSKIVRRNIIDADTGIIRYNEQTAALKVDLRHGEIIQYSATSLRNVRKACFEKYLLNMTDEGFRLERSKDNDRGDREMKIADMQVVVDSAKIAEKRALAIFDTLVSQHLDYITLQKPLQQNTINYSLVQAGGAIPQAAPSPAARSRYSALATAVDRVAQFRSNLFSNMQTVQYNKIRQKKYDVEIQKKYAIPFACLVFVFVGCPLGIRTRGGNFGVSALISLGFFILYWACLIGGEKLADRAIISPFLGMWAGDIIVGILGIILTFRLNNENFNFKRKFGKYFADNKNIKAFKSILKKGK